jgi:hypothetical protein
MQKLQCAAVVASLALATPALAQFGLPSTPSVPSASGGGATVADVDRFMGSAASADKLVSTASTHLLKAVGSKEQVDKYNAQVKAANAIADPKEKEAKLQKAEDDKNATLASIDYAKAKESMAKKADAKQKEAVNASVWNLALGGLKDADLVVEGKKMASGTPDPTIATRILGVKDTVTRLTSQGETLTKIVGSAKVLMSGAGPEALPTKASDAAKEIKDI